MVRDREDRENEQIMHGQKEPHQEGTNSCLSAYMHSSSGASGELAGIHLELG